MSIPKGAESTTLDDSPSDDVYTHSVEMPRSVHNSSVPAQKSTIRDDDDEVAKAEDNAPWYVKCGRALKPAPCPWTAGGYLRLLFLVLIIGGLVAAVIFRKDLSQFLGEDGPLSKFVKKIGVWGPIIYALVYVFCTVFMIPGSVLTLAAGVIFELWVACVTISAGSTIGACLAFLLGRTVLRSKVQEKAETYPVFGAIDTAVGQRGFLMVGLLRLSPVIPFNLLNYMLGLTGVKFWQYGIASWIGMMPGTFLYIYIAYIGKNAAVSAGGSGAQTRADVINKILTFGVGGLVTILVVVLVTYFARKEMQKAMATAESKGQDEHDDHHVDDDDKSLSTINGGRGPKESDRLLG